MRCRNPDKRKDALVKEVKKMWNAEIEKSKFRISSVWQKEKHSQMNVSAWVLRGVSLGLEPMTP